MLHGTAKKKNWDTKLPLWSGWAVWGVRGENEPPAEWE